MVYPGCPGAFQFEQYVSLSVMLSWDVIYLSRLKFCQFFSMVWVSPLTCKTTSWEFVLNLMFSASISATNVRPEIITSYSV